MNYRIIIYNVSDYEQAVRLAVTQYKARYGAPPRNVTLPKGIVLDVGGLQLEIDRFYASPGTCQVGR